MQGRKISSARRDRDFQRSRKKNIAILATLDTKGAEVAAIKELLDALGCDATVIDVGPLGPPALRPDITSAEVARRGGWELSALIRTGKRDRIMEVMGRGAGGLLSRLCSDNGIHGVLGLGGNQGTAISAMAMRVLPFGFPKSIVSTIASGNIRPYVGDRDIGMVFSVGDFLGGANPVTGPILANAVAAVVGMARHGRRVTPEKGRKTVAVTALGNTEPGAARAVGLLKAKGFAAVAFHASGAGGSAMEDLIAEGLIHGVLDLTPHELAEEVLGAGAYQPVNPGRLTAAGEKGIPQVVSTGGLEYLCFGPRESIPPRLRRRRIHMHNPYNANVKVTRGEMARIGGEMAARLSAAAGPVAVLVPLRGWSVYGAPGGVLHDAAGNRILIKALKREIRADIPVREIDAHINDGPFVDACVDQLMTYMEEKKERKTT
ncbi:MAG: Tm-1-like ATP-binding domain-containing protein [Thermodesulfobacteriota bacterium]